MKSLFRHSPLSCKSGKPQQPIKANGTWLLGMPAPPQPPRDALVRTRKPGSSALAVCRQPRSLRSGAAAPRPGHPASGHDGALLRPPGSHLHHVLGPHRHRRALVRAQRTQPRVRMARGPGLPVDPSPAGPTAPRRRALA